MPDSAQWSPNGGDPSLNEIRRVDRFFDALAADEHAYSTDSTEAELAFLLAHDTDLFNRWYAASKLSEIVVMETVARLHLPER